MPNLTYEQLYQHLEALATSDRAVKRFLRLFFQEEFIGSSQWDAVFRTITGSFIGNITQPITTTTEDYHVLTTDNAVLADGSSNTVTVTLPSAVGLEGREFYIKCIGDTFVVDVATTGTEEIDGDSANLPLILHETLTVRSDGTNWWIL